MLCIQKKLLIHFMLRTHNMWSVYWKTWISSSAVKITAYDVFKYTWTFCMHSKSNGKYDVDATDKLRTFDQNIQMKANSTKPRPNELGQSVLSHKQTLWSVSVRKGDYLKGYLDDECQKTERSFHLDDYSWFLVARVA